MKKVLRFIKSMGLLIVLGIISVFVLNTVIRKSHKERIYYTVASSPEAYTVIVLGASVKPDGSLSSVLKDRVDTAFELYTLGKVKRFLLSGDHGQRDYDEPNAMRNYLVKKGVPEEDIFLDHAGFDTYDSMYRAKHVFDVDDAIVVTQEFHLPRAIYIAHKMGMDYHGLVADKRQYKNAGSQKRREMLANVKAFVELLINKEPTYSGPKIPITGDSSLSRG